MLKKLLCLILLISSQVRGEWDYYWLAGTGIATAGLIGYTLGRVKRKSEERIRQNIAQLKLFKTAMDKGFSTALASDLHDVVLDRLPGDIKRASQLSFRDTKNFFGGLLRFGPRYISHKLFGKPVHPAIEQFVLENVKTPEERERILQLICPFSINDEMIALYKSLGIPVFACSNSGGESYHWIDEKSGGKLSDLFTDIQVGAKEENYPQKDKTETFIMLLNKMKAKGINPQAWLYIDDKKKNGKKAEEALLPEGVTVYPYVFKNIDEFKKDLRTAKIIN
jgi:hypothetical protein